MKHMRSLLPILTFAALALAQPPTPAAPPASDPSPAVGNSPAAPSAPKTAPAKGKGKAGGVVITVGPNSIRKSQIDDLVTQMAKAKQTPGELDAKERTAMTQMIATNLIGQELIELEARRLAIEAKPEEIDSMYKVLRSNFPDETSWKRVLKEGGNTEKTFRDKLARQIKADKILNTQVPQMERPTYKEIIDYHTRNKAKFPVNDSLRACQVLLITAKDAPAAEVAQKKADLEKVRAELAKDSADVEKLLARFVMAARQVSQGPEKKDGGDLQRFHPSDFSPEFKKQVTALRVGQMSPVFRTPLGWHLVILTEKYDSKPDSYRLVISQLLAREKAAIVGQSLRKYLRGLAAKYKVNYLEQAYKDTSPAGVYNL
ncbi:MAG TPA: peptidylprolyl isomerase [Fibrobacteria bacterium]|nr:peptidylprolyl isomerase [Fibrobacteria bacterium]